MQINKVLVRVGVGLGLVGGIALWSAVPARAIIIVNSKTAQFGPFGVARGQTARINVANVDDPNIRPSEFPPDPCRVTVGFTDATGAKIAVRTFIVNWSTTKSFDFRLGAPPEPDRTERGARAELRAFVVGDAAPPDPDRPAPTCVATVEVFDSNTGQTTVFMEHGLVGPGDLPAPR